MNLLHYVDTTDLRDGGVPRFVLDAARTMAAQGHPSTILTTNATDTPRAWLENAGADGAAFAGLPSVRELSRSGLPGGFLSTSAMREVRRQLKRADALHLHCVWSIANLQIAAAARAMGVPYVVSLHGMLDDWCMDQRPMKKRAYLSLGGRYMLERAARVHCTASGEVSQSKKWFPRGSEVVMPYIMDLEPYRELPGRELAREKFACLREHGDQPTVLFLSRLHYKKGPELLLRASSLLRDRGVKAQVALAGTGDEAYLRSLGDLAAKLGVADNIHFLGMVKGADKVSLYQNADLFVLPTSQENFGIVLIEALACGTPLITTRGVDIWQDVESSGAATIVDQAPEQLASAIGTMLSDMPRLKSMGDKARSWVFKTYDESVLLPKYERLYASVSQSVGAFDAGGEREAQRAFASIR
jgi:glycosyltransferase involved in cell wall biosynthesis